MIRLALLIISFVSVFAFPWQFTLILLFPLAWYEPLAAIAIGILADTLYYTHGAGIPLMTLTGIITCALSLFSRRYLHGRFESFS
jgi:hypothetical protein